MYGENEHPHAECRERIKELEAEVERLRRLEQELRTELVVKQQEYNELRAEADGVWATRDRVVAEVEKLRAERNALIRQCYGIEAAKAAGGKQ